MRKEDLVKFKNCKIKLILISGSVFTGDIIKITDETLLLKDKYQQHVVISLNQISNIIVLRASENGL